MTGQYGSKIEFDAIVIYEPGQQAQRTGGLRIGVTEGGKYERESTSFLDLEEIESLSKAIAYMLDLSTAWKAETREYAEVIFATKGDFRIGFFQQESVLTAFASCGYVSKASCTFPFVQNLSSVKTITDKGLKMLQEK